MVYPHEDGHPSQYYPGPALINFVDQSNDANRYTTPSTNIQRFQSKCTDVLAELYNITLQPLLFSLIVDTTKSTNITDRSDNRAEPLQIL